MQIQTVMTLTVFLALVPAAQAQRRGPANNDRPSSPSSADRPSSPSSPSSTDRQPANTDRQSTPNADSRSGNDRRSGSDPRSDSAQPRVETRRPPTLNLPTSPILPMTNPIIPISNPVQPVIRYGVGGTPTVVIPPPNIGRPTSNSDRNPDRSRDDFRRNSPVIVVGGGYVGPYVGPYLSPDYLYYSPYETPGPVPGQLPGVRQPEQSAPVYSVPASSPAPAAPVVPVIDEPIYYPDQNIIITPPEPDRILTPPAIGTSKADVLAKYGDPWGTLWVRGTETLHFRGGLTVVLIDGKVSEIR